MAVGFLIPMYFVFLKKSVCFSSPMEAKYLLKSIIFTLGSVNLIISDLSSVSPVVWREFGLL